MRLRLLIATLLGLSAAFSACEAAKLDQAARYSCGPNRTCAAGTACYKGYCVPECTAGASECAEGEICSAGLCVPPFDASVAPGDASLPGSDAAVAGDDAAVAPEDAAAPSEDAALPGDDASVPEDASLAVDAGRPDVGSGDPDAGSPDIGAPDLPDVGAADVGRPDVGSPDAGVGCQENTSQACGRCGSQVCTNGSWSLCAEPVGAECYANAEQVCDNCGKRICSPTTCRWGLCFSKSGACRPNDRQSCGLCVTQTCQADCTWGPCNGGPFCEYGDSQGCTTVSGCPDSTCTCPGTPCTQKCDGTQKCNTDCTWGDCAVLGCNSECVCNP